MTGPIIPADQWPEDAALHTWDEENGQGYWTVYDKVGGFWTIRSSEIPMPDGWDWHVPVVRHQSPAIDLERVRASLQSLLNWIDDWAETPGESGIEAIAEEAEAVLALIDEQGDDSFPCCGGNDETPREHCMDCPDYPGQPTKGEGE